MKRKGRKMSPWDVLAANTKQDREDAEHIQLVWDGELGLTDHTVGAAERIAAGELLRGKE